MTNKSFEYITNLQYSLKAANNELLAFKSGEKYTQLEDKIKKLINHYESQIKRLKKELEQAYRQQIKIREQWFEVFDDTEREHKKEIKKLQKKLNAMENRALKAERKVDLLTIELSESRKNHEKTIIELEDEKGKNQKLIAQLNHNYENSSIPSSLCINRKKIPNSREKTNRKPGAQKGHKHHGRKRQKPTSEPILLQPSSEILNDPDFKRTNKLITKQLVRLKIIVEAQDYQAYIYRNYKTGEKVHASFPDGVINDVNYDGTIKSFLYLLNNECCVSIDKCRQFLLELTEGKLDISKGMINKLNKEFSNKSKSERKEILQQLISSPVVHTDFTNAKVNGKNAYVLVSSTPDREAIYTFKETKGHKGIEGTPIEHYQGTLVHDHDVTFYKYGQNHQECLAHVLRQLKDSISNESERLWNKHMYDLIREMIHYKKTNIGIEIDIKAIEDFEERYDKILNEAYKEYEDVPYSKYYKDGYNLYKRLKEYKNNHLLFLHDNRVPTTNNMAERLLRNYKRKQKQAVSFRSKDSVNYYCNGASVLVKIRKNNEDFFKCVSDIFNKPIKNKDDVD